MTTQQNIADTIHNDAKINELIQHFIDAWNQHDAKKFADLFEDDADHTNVLGIHRKGKQEIEDSHRPLFEGIWVASTLSNLETSIRYITDNIASVNLRWKLDNIIYPKSETPAMRQGLIHFVLKRAGAEWKVSVMHNMDLAR